MSIRLLTPLAAALRRFMGRIAGRTLRPGAYKLVVTATPVAGGATKTSMAPFKIVR